MDKQDIVDIFNGDLVATLLCEYCGDDIVDPVGYTSDDNIKMCFCSYECIDEYTDNLRSN